ncbi:MAG: ATP-binding protein [Acidobacteriota bacterium]
MTEIVCPICSGTGWRVIERNGLSGAERCSCAVASRPASLRKASGIPVNYEHASLDNFQIPQDNPIARAGLGSVMMKVRSFVREYPAADRPGLLLVGETGSGKTHLAIAALKAVMEKGHEGLFFDYQNLLDKIRAGYNSSSGSSDREAYRAAMDAEVLLLDDLGSHRVTEWVEDTVTSIITYRCNHQKTLIATTNLDVEDTGQAAYTTAGGTAVHRKTLGDVIGARARSRLFEMCRVVRMPSVEDYRVRRAR